MNSEDDRLLRPEDVAEMTGVDLGTLSNWRYQRRFIPYVKVGKCVRYRLGAVRAFLRDREVFPIREFREAKDNA